MMRLYTSVTSPYARKVRAVALLLDLPLEEIEVAPFERPDALLAINPLSKVPSLVLDDGTAVNDSPVIVQALDHLSGGRLLPADPVARLAVLGAEALADGILDAALSLTLERRRPADQQSAAALDRHQGAIQRALDAIDRTEWSRWSGLPSDLPGIALVSALEYLDLRHRDLIDWRAGHPTLVAVHDAWSARRELVATRPG